MYLILNRLVAFHCRRVFFKLAPNLHVLKDGANYECVAAIAIDCSSTIVVVFVSWMRTLHINHQLLDVWYHYRCFICICFVGVDLLGDGVDISKSPIKMGMVVIVWRRFKVNALKFIGRMEALVSFLIGSAQSDICMLVKAMAMDQWRAIFLFLCFLWFASFDFGFIFHFIASFIESFGHFLWI